MKTTFLISIFIVANIYHMCAQNTNAAKLAKPVFKNEVNTFSLIDTNKLYKVEHRTIATYNLPQVELKNVVTEPITQTYNEGIKSKIATTITPKVYLSVQRKKIIANIFIPQYLVQPDGSIVAITSYTLQLQETYTNTSNKTSGTRVYATNSILASGNFYKIALPSRGIYKIDYNFIKNNIGIEPTTLDVAKIRLFGNGGTMLDENNVTSRPDDLIENNIEIYDGGDGQFNPGDYFIFYANGPHTLSKDSINKSFKHAFNIYSELSYYFLNFNTAIGKRITKTATPTSANITVNSYNDVQYYERDSINLGGLGKQWYCDEFSANPGRSLSHDYTFNFPNLDINNPIKIKTRIAGTSEGSNSTLKIKVNGVAAYQHDISSFLGSYAIANSSEVEKTLNVNNSIISLNATLVQASQNAKCNLDYILINARRNLIFSGMHYIADWNSVATGNIAQYDITNTTTNIHVWDITDPLQVYALNTTSNGNTTSFTQEASSLHTFAAFDDNQYLIPSYVGKVDNQNLHSYALFNYIIITNNELKAAAEKLASHHSSKRNYKTKVVTVDEIYNEFSSGSQDVSAIRDFIKMLYDKATTSENMIKDVLLFGDASYDYKDRLKANTNFSPTYETYESLDRTNGYCTDDFFGFLDDSENINNTSIINTLDVGIGRLPVTGINEANTIVDKIIRYDSPASFGAWKNNMTFNADNGDNNNHLTDAESVANTTIINLPQYNVSKIYVDAFEAQSTPGGIRVPDANVIINNQIYNGTFVMNYNGHGGALGWCDERIFGINEINTMDNKNKMPLFITATCDFAQYDNPGGRSAGELLILKPNGGAIALMTTTQLVYSTPNKDLNLNYFNKGFSPIQVNGTMPTLGDALLLSKNIEYAVNNNDVFRLGNFRKFVLLGDPGLPLAFPTYNMQVDSINGLTLNNDTLKALGKYTISGSVRNRNGNQIVSDFNGEANISVFDKFKKNTTLGNNAESPKYDYLLQDNILFKGKASIKNGKFTCTFVLPKDINYEVGKGKISLYASSTLQDASGYNNTINIGSNSNIAITDNKGPEIKAYLNNEKFVNGGITTKNATLIVHLFDENGINTSGNSLGHDITAILDQNAQQTYVLNNFFEGNIDDYQKGIIRFPLTNLTPGSHTLKIKAWDILNNSSEIEISFIVVSNSEATLTRLYNYPNPFSTKTQFMFEHNMPNEILTASLTIYTVSGKIVRTMHETINDAGTRYCGFDWDGTDQYGDKLARGVYIYKMSLKSSTGKKDTQFQKLMLIR